jgi:hypothetical protein
MEAAMHPPACPLSEARLVNGGARWPLTAAASLESPESHGAAAVGAAACIAAARVRAVPRSCAPNHHVRKQSTPQAVSQRRRDASHGRHIRCRAGDAGRPRCWCTLDGREVRSGLERGGPAIF